MKKIPACLFVLFFSSLTAFAQVSSVFINRLPIIRSGPVELHLPTGLLPRFNPQNIDTTLGTRILSAMNAAYAKTQPFNRHGVAASVIVPGLPQWSGSVGTADDINPMDTNLLFECASNTKTFVTALIMRMQDSGKLSIKDSIYKWLPKKYPNVDSAITIKMLLNHSSGIYDIENDDSTSALLYDEYITNPGKHWTADEILMNYVKAPNFKPGTSYKYSNTNFLLLGLIAQSAGGKSLREQLHTYLFNPLKLTHTFFGGEDSITMPFAHNWTPADNSNPASDYFDIDKTAQLTGGWAFGNICSTPGDLVRWSHALYLGKVVSPNALKAMITMNHWPDGSYYGLGTQFAPYYTHSFYGHTGSLLGFKSAQFTNLQDSVSVGLYVNWDSNPNISDIYMNDYLIAIMNEIYKTAASVVQPDNSQPIAISVFPNPSIDHVTFDYRLDHQGPVSLAIYSMLGEKKETLVSESLSAGIYSVYLETSLLIPGTYFYVLQTPDGIANGKISVQ